MNDAKVSDTISHQVLLSLYSWSVSLPDSPPRCRRVGRFISVGSLLWITTRAAAYLCKHSQHTAQCWHNAHTHMHTVATHTPTHCLHYLLLSPEGPRAGTTRLIAPSLGKWSSCEWRRTLDSSSLQPSILSFLEEETAKESLLDENITFS